MPTVLLHLRALPLLLGALLLSGCDIGEWELSSHAPFEKTVALDPMGAFALENVNGNVTVEPWDRSSVQIEGEKSASNERTLEEIRIEVSGEGDRVQVKTRMPRRGFFSGGSGKVDYHIRLPVQARLELQTVNGGIDTGGMQGRIRASTVNGSIKVTDAGGEVNLTTVNGNIEARYSKLPGEARHGFTTVNGSVTLWLPDVVDAEFDARAVNGSINTDFPLEVSGKPGNSSLKGRIGEGRSSFRIKTVNGGVKVLKKEMKVVKSSGGAGKRPSV